MIVINRAPLLFVETIADLMGVRNDTHHALAVQIFGHPLLYPILLQVYPRHLHG
jgi:hypothetical protein